MSLESNKALARKAIKLWTTGNLNGIDEIYWANCINHQHHHPSSDLSLKGTDSWKKFIKEFREAFPDLEDTIEDQIAEGNKVATRFASRGTHKGKLMGIEPTNKKLTWSGIVIDRIESGKIIETWVNWDLYGLLEQLDVISLHTVPVVHNA